MNILYTATVVSTGEGRNGHVRSNDGLIDSDVRTPVEMGGGGGATNPEQLFAAGYAACFHSALRRVAGSDHLDVEGSSVTARVGIGPLPTGGFGLAVTLDVSLPKVEPDVAQATMAKAHMVCPYSNATRNNIDVTLNLV